MSNIPCLDLPQLIDSLIQTDSYFDDWAFGISTDRPTPPRMIMYSVFGDPSQPLSGPAAMEESSVQLIVISTRDQDEASKAAIRLNKIMETGVPPGGIYVNSVDGETKTFFGPFQRDSRMEVRVRNFSQQQWYTAKFTYITNGRDGGPI